MSAVSPAALLALLLAAPLTADVRATLRAALPRAQVQILAGLGHNPFWEDPQRCAQLINTFLIAVPAPGASL